MGRTVQSLKIKRYAYLSKEFKKNTDFNDAEKAVAEWLFSLEATRLNRIKSGEEVEDYVYTSIDTICKETGIKAKKTVNKCLAKLHYYDIIRITTSNNEHVANRYVINSEWMKQPKKENIIVEQRNFNNNTSIDMNILMSNLIKTNDELLKANDALLKANEALLKEVRELNERLDKFSTYDNHQEIASKEDSKERVEMRSINPKISSSLSKLLSRMDGNYGSPIKIDEVAEDKVEEISIEKLTPKELFDQMSFCLKTNLDFEDVRNEIIRRHLAYQSDSLLDDNEFYQIFDENEMAEICQENKIMGVA